jgi:hypothetical protein
MKEKNMDSHASLDGLAIPHAPVRPGGPPINRSPVHTDHFGTALLKITNSTLVSPLVLANHIKIAPFM